MRGRPLNCLHASEAHSSRALPTVYRWSAAPSASAVAVVSSSSRSDSSLSSSSSSVGSPRSPKAEGPTVPLSERGTAPHSGGVRPLRSATGCCARNASISACVRTLTSSSAGRVSPSQP